MVVALVGKELVAENSDAATANVRLRIGPVARLAQANAYVRRLKRLPGVATVRLEGIAGGYLTFDIWTDGAAATERLLCAPWRAEPGARVTLGDSGARREILVTLSPGAAATNGAGATGCTTRPRPHAETTGKLPLTP